MKEVVLGRWVIPDAQGDAIENGAVVVEDGRIADVGPADRLCREHAGAVVSGDRQCAVMPGLINAHHHSSAASHVQHGAPDMLLESWLKALAVMRRSPTRLDILLSATRQLQGGVTCVVDLASLSGSAEAVARECGEALRAYDTVGMRCAYGPGVGDQNFLGVGPGDCDERFLANLPCGLSERLRSHYMPGADLTTPADYIGVMEDLIGAWDAHERIDVWFGPPGPPWVSDPFLELIGDAASRLDVNIQTHVSESYYEKLQGPMFHGAPMLVHLHRLGLTGPRLSLAHGVWMTEEEIAVMAETGTAVSHNPSSNLRLRAGIAPLTAFLDAGVVTALGMDSTTINDDEDMFAEMRLALRLARSPTYHESAPSPGDILGCATRGGATLMRKDDQLGRLAPGFAADLVLIDMKAATTPWVAPEISPRELALMRVRGTDVRDVMVAGEWVLKDRLPTRVDLDDAIRELHEVMAATPFPASSHALALEALPHVEAWYESWDHPPRRPYTAMNSRT